MNRSDEALTDPPRTLPLMASVMGSEGAPQVLAIHGITASRRYWTTRIRPLADRYRILIPDLPGFGLSPKPFADYTMDFFIEALEGFLDRSSDTRRPLRIVGHSLGALLGLELAARHPGRVERLALLNLPRFTDPELAHRLLLDGSASYRNILTVNSFAANWAQVRRNGLRMTTRYLAGVPWAVVADARKFSFRSISSTLENCVLHYNVDPVMRRLPSDIPILFIHGAADRVAPPDAVQELSSRPPHPDVHLVDGAGHNLFHTHHREVMPLITRFLDDPVAAATPRT